MPKAIVAFVNGILLLDPVPKIFLGAVPVNPVPLFIDKFQEVLPILVVAMIARRGVIQVE